MTTDINGTVVAIQGNAISSSAPTDGYTLTWDASDGYWVARPTPGLRKVYFTANDTWTPPAGVTNILVIASGGGGGGGPQGAGSNGGNGSTTTATNGSSAGNNTGAGGGGGGCGATPGNGGNGGSGYLYIIY